MGFAQIGPVISTSVQNSIPTSALECARRSQPRPPRHRNSALATATVPKATKVMIASGT
jgi:hypothetical protein